MREEACSADTIIRDEDALREPYVREGEQTLSTSQSFLKQSPARKNGLFPLVLHS